MTHNSVYYDLAKKQIEKEQHFMTSALIKSKIRLGLDNDPAVTDEAIMYLSGLLTTTTQPYTDTLFKTYIRNTDMEIFKVADMHSDKTHKYYVYKTNADHLLIHLGIFQNIKEKKEARPCHSATKEHHISRGKLYYEIAQDYLFQIYRKKTALFDVFEHLSAGFEKHLYLLTEIKKDYFSLLMPDKESSFARFLEGMNSMEEKILFEKKQDQLLDLYSDWLKTKSDTTKESIFKLALELQLINHEFKFKISV